MGQLYALNSLKKVSEIHDARDIKQLSHAQFPGTHCPLFGVALTAGYVNDLMVLVTGTDECAYYTKGFSISRQSADQAMNDNIFSFALKQEDVVFGCQEKLEEALLYLDKHYHPKAILIATTCVLEVIGEDFEALIYALKDRISAKLLVVHTEHFKCNSHIPGIERTLECLSDLMEPQHRLDNCVNLLGHRYEGIYDTELVRLLTSKGIEVHMVLPSSCSADSIRKAPAAALNIVTDFTALVLAERMKEAYGVDYVYFDKYLSPSRIFKGYQTLMDRLHIDLTEEIRYLMEHLQKLIQDTAPLLKGKRFIYGNTPMLAFEMCSFLCGLGMEPLLIQARDLYIHDDVYMREIVDHGMDPYVSRIANIAPLQLLYQQMQPDIYIGHENPQRLMKLGIVQTVLDFAAAKLGFEVPAAVIKALAESVQSYTPAPGKEHHHAAV